MQKLVEKIRELTEVYDLRSFDWAMPASIPIELPNGKMNSFDKNVYLKENLSELLKNDQELEVHYWIIQQWGGIGSFKKNEANDKRIRKFISELEKGSLTKNNFNAISSLSKIASFLDPDNFVIYDSRVIYALNWLLFNFSESQELFPQPVGRSAKLSLYDMQTIFRLSGKQFEYMSHKEAFHNYCHLIKDLSSELSDVFEKPYMLEMFIFMIAPEWGVKDIENSVSIQISHD
jgi:hypothetical protein